MKICHISLSREFRGGERQTLALIRALPAGVRQRVVVRRSSPLHQALLADPALRAEVVPIASSPVAAFRAAAGVDILHAEDGRAVAAGALRSVLGTPFIATRRIAKAPTDSAPTRWSYSRAGQVVCVSDAVRDIMEAYDARLEACTIRDCVPPLPDPDPVAVTAIRRQQAGKFLIGQVGQLDDAAKGQRTTIAAARSLERSRPDLVFLLIGQGRDEDALKTESRGLGNVLFAGWRADIQNYYAALDVLVHPSRSEGLGSALLEAMSFGVPAVAARTGGIPEIVRHGTNGFLFEPGDERTLATHLTRLADDADLRMGLVRGAQETAAEFSAERMAEQYLKRYAELLRRPRFRRRRPAPAALPQREPADERNPSRQTESHAPRRRDAII